MKKKERKLSKAEERRKLLFEEKSRALVEKGYECRDLTISFFTANVMAFIVMLPIIICFILVNIKVNTGGSGTISGNQTMVGLLIFAFLIVLHEVIHGLIWGIFTKNHFKDVEFGFVLESFTPYCTCKEPVGKWVYITGAAMPTILLGFLPAVVGIVSNYQLLFFISQLMILSGGGDFTIILKILFHKSKAKEILYMDHPYLGGGMAFER